MSKRLGLALAAVSSLLAFAPTPAHAGGLEFAGPGTTALGRGGAAYARPGDPMALWYNPANLADLQGIQLSLQTHLVMYEACHRREGTYGSYSGVAANDPTTMTELERFNTGIAAASGMYVKVVDADDWVGPESLEQVMAVLREEADSTEPIDMLVTNYVYDGVLESGETNTQAVDFANPANGTGGIKWRRNGFLGLAEDNIEDGGWVRLRELTLAYNLPQSWLEEIHFEGATIGLSGRNLWLMTDYTGVDPETNLRGDSNDTGWDYFNLPNTRSYSVSINLKF